MSKIIQHPVLFSNAGSNHTIVATILPTNFLGLPKKGDIFFAHAILQKSIISGNRPQITIRGDFTDSTEKFKGYGLEGIIQEPVWYIKEINDPLASLYS